MNCAVFDTGVHVPGSPGVIFMRPDFWDPRSTGSEFMYGSGNQNLKGTSGSFDTGGPQITL